MIPQQFCWVNKCPGPWTSGPEQDWQRLIPKTGYLAQSKPYWSCKMISPLGTIKTIMDQLLLELQNDQPSVDQITEALTACTELLLSVGKASETEVSALAYNLYVLSLSRRDFIVKNIKVSDSLKEEMKHAPLMWEQHNIKCSEDDQPQYMIRGLCSKIEQDRKREVSVAMQDLLLKSATSGKSFKSPASTVQITFIFIDFRVCDFAFAFKKQNAPCVSRFKRILFSDRFQFAF